MDKTPEKQKVRFGLIGKNIAYSFSRRYFTQKFKDEGLDTYSYENFDIDDISQFIDILATQKNIKGFNVTIPYKEAIMPYLHKLNKKAEAIGAVNTIRFTKKGTLVGYNTDYFGFKKSLEPLLKSHHKNALILGTGGASKAIAYALKSLGIAYAFVSRQPSKQVTYTYTSLSENVIKTHQIIINCTPLGTYPNTEDCPDIPYHALTTNHLLYDLIYNPKETTFLKQGNTYGCQTFNGYSMLELQAKKAWKIWNST
ncbi:MAG: shikimate dehydrogenase [Flavobacteriaceae bacterium]|nr:shikimate dehydrogenase [Flavobacteriaceae bacterium]